MAYLDTLTSHNTLLQGLINKANALPDAGSGGGGGSLATCTVTIVNNVATAWEEENLVIATTVLNDNGIIEPFHYFQEGKGEVIIPNVICGCALVIEPVNTIASSCTCTNSTVVIRNDYGYSSWVLQPNGDDTITIEL